MLEHPRYRIEDGYFCIDVRLKSSKQIFDGRDPAPFRERDLDQGAVEYIVDALEELPPKAPIKVALWIADEPTSEISAQTIVDAVHGHFAYAEVHLNRVFRRHMRRGYLFLLVGLGALGGFLLLAELTAALPVGHARQILREGLVITGWVAMWRPLEVLLYDWWPLVEERRLARRMLQAPVVVHHGPGPSAPTQ